jgi:large subunit ribosomal protein L20
MTYSRFINALKKANVLLDRKVLSDMAIKDAAGFEKLVGLAKQHLTPVTA